MAFLNCEIRYHWVHLSLQFLKNAQKASLIIATSEKAKDSCLRYQNVSSYYCDTHLVILFALIKLNLRTIYEFIVYIFTFLQSKINFRNKLLVFKWQLLRPGELKIYIYLNKLSMWRNRVDQLRSSWWNVCINHEKPVTVDLYIFMDINFRGLRKRYTFMDI